jgi:hypothetical protein
MSDRHPSSTPESSPAARLLSQHWKVIATLAGAVVFQLAFVSSFTGAEARPALHHVTIGLVGSPPSITGHADTSQDSVVRYRRLSDLAAARQAVRDGHLPAALVTGGHQMLIVAEAAGLTLTAAIEQVATTQAAAAHTSLAVQDVRPLPAGDPRGLGSFLLVLGWIIGGYLGMTLLTRVLGPKARGLRGTATLTAWAALYAVTSAGLGVVLMDPLFGCLTGHPWALLGAGSLIVFAAAMTTAALVSLFGMAGIVVAIVAFVILGNPTSGGSVPNEMLSGGYRFLAEVLPNHAAVSLVHGIQYYGGNGLGHPIFVLGLYAAVAVAVCFAQAYRRIRITTGRNPVADTSLAAAAR